MKENEHRTEDLAFAAFLKVKGYELLRAEKIDPANRRSKRIFFFKVPDGEIEGLRLPMILMISATQQLPVLRLGIICVIVEALG